MYTLFLIQRYAIFVFVMTIDHIFRIRIFSQLTKIKAIYWFEKQLTFFIQLQNNFKGFLNEK